ncbi:ubiquitin-conjugating enzyme E2-22 kDa-like [Drosophila nasuta]|uniref:ubiquitin-conjugating enzyme E2-22 kDa-like n=1 Tax=Drosophila nasuta TaxID=42062 RepID=UPI00295F4601|nr:ubiquitin-conjugating enzyme E2-22 kDa-like [Drosophila nasuta]
MANISVVRIHRELVKLLQSEEVRQGWIKIELVNGSWTELRVEIIGPKDTPYEGGRLALEIKVPDDYPFEPPKVRFTTCIWHPNISLSGMICQDKLKFSWSAAITLRTTFLSLQALLFAPEPNEPQNIVASTQYMEKHDLVIVTAKHWTAAYAGGSFSSADCDAKIQRIKDIGVDEKVARVTVQ